MKVLTENFIDNLNAPIFIALCAILALLSLRNMHLSDRMRAVLKNYQDFSKESFLTQAKEFHKRYKSTGNAFTTMMIVLILSIIIQILGKSFIWISFTLMLIWIILFVISISLIAKELLTGRRTLKMELDRVMEETKPQTKD